MYTVIVNKICTFFLFLFHLGFCAGVFGAMINTPGDTIRTVVQKRVLGGLPGERIICCKIIKIYFFCICLWESMAEY